MDAPLTATGVSSPSSTSDLHLRPTSHFSDEIFSPPALPDNDPNVSSKQQEEKLDEPTCRLCFGHDSPEEIVELGSLIVPCKCSGTARFIHPLCLDSWRQADRKNGFYACGTCGFSYRLRSSLWTKLASYRATIPLLALALLLLPSFLVGFAAPAIMRFAENFDAPKAHVLALPRRLLLDFLDWLQGDFVNLGDFLRETVSLLSYPLGDCRWTSANAPWFMRSSGISKDGSSFVKEWVYREAVTACGEAWGNERDDQAVSRGVEVVTHLVGGEALLGLGAVLASQLATRYYISTFFLSFLSPRLYRLLRIKALESPPLLAFSSVWPILGSFRTRAKRARTDNRLFHWSQLAIVSITILSCAWTVSLAIKAARWIVKNRVGKVERVVLDVREVEGVKEE